MIQRKDPDSYRAMWSAKGQAALATTSTASGAGTFSTVLHTIGA